MLRFATGQSEQSAPQCSGAKHEFKGSQLLQVLLLGYLTHHQLCWSKVYLLNHKHLKPAPLSAVENLTDCASSRRKMCEQLCSHPEHDYEAFLDFRVIFVTKGLNYSLPQFFICQMGLTSLSCLEIYLFSWYIFTSANCPKDLLREK